MHFLSSTTFLALLFSTSVFAQASLAAVDGPPDDARVYIAPAVVMPANPEGLPAPPGQPEAPPPASPPPSAPAPPALDTSAKSAVPPPQQPPTAYEPTAGAPYTPPPAVTAIPTYVVPLVPEPDSSAPVSSIANTTAHTTSSCSSHTSTANSSHPTTSISSHHSLTSSAHNATTTASHSTARNATSTRLPTSTTLSANLTTILTTSAPPPPPTTLISVPTPSPTTTHYGGLVPGGIKGACYDADKGKCEPGSEYSNVQSVSVTPPSKDVEKSDTSGSALGAKVEGMLVLLAATVVTGLVIVV